MNEEYISKIKKEILDSCEHWYGTDVEEFINQVIKDTKEAVKKRLLATGTEFDNSPKDVWELNMERVCHYIDTTEL